MCKALSEPGYEEFLDLLLSMTDYQTFVATMRSKRMKVHHEGRTNTHALSSHCRSIQLKSTFNVSPLPSKGAAKELRWHAGGVQGCREQARSAERTRLPREGEMTVKHSPHLQFRSAILRAIANAYKIHSHKTGPPISPARRPADGLGSLLA